MTLITSGTIETVQTVWEGVAGAPYFTKLFFDNSGPDMQYAVDAWADYLELHEDKWPSALQWTVQSAEQINVATGEVVGYGTATPRTGNGGGGTEALPWRTQALVALRTPEFVSGRRLQGRIFLPAMIEAMNVAGRFDEAFRDGMQTSLQDVIGDEFLDTLGVYSRTHNCLAYVTTVRVNSDWSSLRSRSA